VRACNIGLSVSDVWERQGRRGAALVVPTHNVPTPYQGPALIFLLVCAENAPRLCAWIDWRPVFIAALRLCLCELMWIVLLAGLIGTSFRNRLRSRIISSPSLGNFRDPGSRPRLLARHRSARQKRVAHATQVAC